MSRPEVAVDVVVLHEEIQKTYTDVATDTERDFIFPTGRAWAQELGYPEPELSGVPDATAAASCATSPAASTRCSSPTSTTPRPSRS
jgi:hypothetical protein